MAKRKAQGSNVEFNMTPMIDVTFQLIIFFIITGQIVSNDLAPLKVPAPADTQAREELVDKPGLIINVVSEVGDEEGPKVDLRKAARADYWWVAQQKVKVGDMDALTTIFREELDRIPEAKRKDYKLEVRSDYRVKYADVETVMLAAAEAGFQTMNITAIADPKKQGARK
ncbi:MAG: ExbD/TolR family protein [Planctomycetota bacterium]|jgi:biopolymer transport protein ExbD